jgi:epoxyqueuosine reductase
MDYEYLRAIISPKFWYIKPEQVQVFKLNALRAMHNDWSADYLAAVEKAGNDPEEQVRGLASWVAARH